MKRSTGKKTTERRKKARSSSKRASRSSQSTQEKAKKALQKGSDQACHYCGSELSGESRALFVEEEVGRIFCSEGCIAAYFGPEIERMEKEFFRRLSANDLTAEERESLAHLRWITLQEPDEVWREKTVAGDYRYILLSEFQPSSKKIWSVCICLFLRGEPSFLYLAFTTKNASMVNAYRRGEEVQWVRPTKSSAVSERVTAVSSSGQQNSADDTGAAEGGDVDPHSVDRLADPWTEDETFLAQLSQERKEDDIPLDEFSLYHSCVEGTLETPDEVWSTRLGGEDSFKLYYFIRHYPDESPDFWYLIIARETENEEQIEILETFPTRDSELVDRYRRGEQEVGQPSTRPSSRVIH